MRRLALSSRHLMRRAPRGGGGGGGSGVGGGARESVVSEYVVSNSMSVTNYLTYLQERATQLALDADESVQTCRSCGATVSKVDGCDKFMCRCGYKFCWKCGAEGASCRCTGNEHGFADPRARGGSGASPAKGKRRRSPWQP